jgi:hypothetical protein
MTDPSDAQLLCPESKCNPSCHFVVILQVVFAGVFLLTRAPQPAAPAEQSTELKQASSKARVAYVGYEPEQAHSLTAAPSDEHRWRLSAVRSAQSGGSCKHL